MLAVHETPTCSVAGTAEIVGSKWTVLIVHDLSEGPRRFSEIEVDRLRVKPKVKITGFGNVMRAPTRTTLGEAAEEDAD